MNSLCAFEIRILQKVKLDKNCLFSKLSEKSMSCRNFHLYFFHLESQFQKLDIIFYSEDQVLAYFGGSNLMRYFLQVSADKQVNLYALFRKLLIGLSSGFKSAVF